MSARPNREPAISAPWPALLVSALILGAYALQSRAPDTQGFTLAYALRPAEVEAGRWTTLFTSMFLHGGWTHALANAAFALPFGAAVARLHGPGLPSALTFFAFYLLCGLVGGLVHVVFNLGDTTPVVGASGAVSGLMGAGARLIGQSGRLGPLSGPFVVTLTTVYVILNVVMAVFGFAFNDMGAGVAWQAHLGGYFAGLLLIGPWFRLFGDRSPSASPGDPYADPSEPGGPEPRVSGPWGARGSPNEGS